MQSLIVRSVLIGVLTFIGSTALAGLEDGLVAYYPFSGDATDASGFGHDGVVIGAVLAPDRHGVPDSAYEFDGMTNYIQVPTSQLLGMKDVLTLSAWVQHLSTSSPQHIVNRSELHNGYRLAAWWANPVGYSLELYEDDGTQQIIADLQYPVIGQWTHVAAVWDGATMQIYRNGLLLNESPFVGTLSVGDHGLYIGVLVPDPWPVQGFFHGSIDEVRVYDRALSGREIRYLAAEPMQIDIKPNSEGNQVSIRSRRLLPVAILSDDLVDASLIYAESVRFGPAEAPPDDYKISDVNKDGDEDLLLYFQVQESGLACEDTEAYLSASTQSGMSLVGWDHVSLKGCR